MNKGIVLTPEFLDSADIMPVEGSATDYTKPSVYDIPTEVDVSAEPSGEVVFRFVYPDREETAAEIPLDDTPDIFVKRGRYSGKLMTLRVPEGRKRFLTVVERLKSSAGRQKRKNQELNFLLLSNIIRRKQSELQPD